MKLRPMNGRVVVRPDVPEEKVGSIIIPEDVREQRLQGRVVEVATGLSVKRGDLVAYGRIAGMPFNIEGVDYLMLEEFEIFGVLEEA